MFGYDTSEKPGVQLPKFDEETAGTGAVLSRSLELLSLGNYEDAAKILDEIDAVEASKARTYASDKLRKEQDAIKKIKNRWLGDLRITTNAIRGTSVSDGLREATGRAIPLLDAEADQVLRPRKFEYCV